MDFSLTFEEARVLGCLIEKERTTPEYYPLTLNALVNACNQKSNRDPIVSFDEETVLEALEDLREKKVAMRVDAAGSRVGKFKHTLGNHFELTSDQTAIICELLIRGPQTVGQLRSRCARMAPLDSLEETRAAVAGLESPETGEPLLVQLPVQPGKKERRYAHLLSGEPVVPVAEIAAPAPDPLAQSVTERREREKRLAEEVERLGERVNELEQTLSALRTQFSEFRDQFD